MHIAREIGGGESVGLECRDCIMLGEDKKDICSKLLGSGREVSFSDGLEVERRKDRD